MVDQFLDALPVRPKGFPILEPCAGKGSVRDVLSSRYGSGAVEAYDIEPEEGVKQADFLEEDRRFPTVITNPPFSLSMEFIQKCMEVATSRFSLLFPIEYIHGQERYEKLFSGVDRWELACLHVYTRRAMMTNSYRQDGMYGTGMVTWAWFTWMRRAFPVRSNPKIYWIDNNAFILRSGKR
jgi:predicted RNA methylase